jgi:UDP-N-acetylmuramoyl-tripeptide--D-alanyl-D-alanine ligase
LYQHLIDSQGTVFINSQNHILANMAKRFKSPVFYPAKNDYYHCRLKSSDPFLIIETEDGAEVTTHLVGAYNFENIAVALCIGKYFGVPASDAQQAVADYQPGNMRSQVLTRGSNTIILDAYNANPSSMEAAIDNLARMKSNKRVAILGDMYELEEEAEREHQRIGALLAEKKIDEAMLCGKLFQAARATLPGAKFFESKAELASYLRQHPLSGAVILVKASRGMALETIVDFL